MESASPTRTLRRPPPSTPVTHRHLGGTIAAAPASDDASSASHELLPVPTQAQVDAYANEITQLVCAMSIKLVCIDFDTTFVRVHTGGTWSRSAAELRRHVRPLFLALVPRLVQSGVHVAVVTFSPQTQLIRDVLALSFPTNDIAQQLILRCDEPSWQLTHRDTLSFAPLWQTGGRHLDRTCKLPFVISAALQASDVRRDVVRNRDTLLFDDDAANIRVVNDSGIAGVYFDPTHHTDAAALLKQLRRFHAVAMSASAAHASTATAAAMTTSSSADFATALPLSPLQTPSKKQPTARMVRLMASPESRFIAPTPSSSVQLRHRGHGSGSASAPARTSRFHLCTPSPVTKLRSTVDMGRPRSKRTIRLMRNIENDLHELHLPVAPTAATSTPSTNHSGLSLEAPLPLRISLQPSSPQAKLATEQFDVSPEPSPRQQSPLSF